MTMFGIARPLGNRGRWQSHPYWHRFGDRRVRTLHETFLALIERLTMIREIQLPIELTQSVQQSRLLQLVRKARKVTCRISATTRSKPPPEGKETRSIRSPTTEDKVLQRAVAMLSSDTSTHASASSCVLPVILPGRQRAKESELPGSLQGTTWVEFRRSLDEEDALHRLVCCTKSKLSRLGVRRTLTFLRCRRSVKGCVPAQLAGGTERGDD
jgi:hypothetical protein